MKRNEEFGESGEFRSSDAEKILTAEIAKNIREGRKEGHFDSKPLLFLATLLSLFFATSAEVLCDLSG